MPELELLRAITDERVHPEFKARMVVYSGDLNILPNERPRVVVNTTTGRFWIIVGDFQIEGIAPPDKVLKFAVHTAYSALREAGCRIPGLIITVPANTDKVTRRRHDKRRHRRTDTIFS